MISTIFDALIIRLCNSNVCDELSMVSNRSIGEVGEVIISLLLLLSNRWETVRTISALGESVSSTPWNRSWALVWITTCWPYNNHINRRWFREKKRETIDDEGNLQLNHYLLHEWIEHSDKYHHTKYRQDENFSSEFDDHLLVKHFSLESIFEDWNHIWMREREREKKEINLRETIRMWNCYSVEFPGG